MVLEPHPSDCLQVLNQRHDHIFDPLEPTVESPSASVQNLDLDVHVSPP
jgi:hypothetical protein